ncbi:MAG TPA: hypothetical protein VE642_05210 [Pyrinomonadaceae bacterium]|nr:hypothetical protein [Pyrinomonadaceae bacterium]
MDVRGRVTGLEGLSPEWRREVEAVLQARRVQRPAQLGELGVEAEVLLGRTDGGRGADIVGPVGKVVESDRPSFRWSGPADASGYTVAVFDSHFKQVAQSGLLSVTEWTPPEALQRGTTYVWKVTTFRDGEAIVSPSPPAPEARFMVLGRAAADELARARRLRPASHLTLGVLYARAGMTDEAEREFQALAASNPDSGAARDLLLSVREWRRTP